MAAPAVILAGGASTRMGQEKATMLVDGVTMVVRVAHALRDAGCSPLLISVRDVEQRSRLAGILSHLADVEFVLDDSPHRGSRHGLITALHRCVDNNWLRVQLTPCDVPWLDNRLVSILWSNFPNVGCRLVLPRSAPPGSTGADGLEPLLAAVEPVALLAAFTDADNDARLVDVMRRLPHRVVSEDEWQNAGIKPECFLNVNQMKDFRQSPLGH
uniref:Molybdopterin-guanine dinucleotide biosynthesis protein A (MobA) n=1 Tax=uncultured marine group II/III euryarchaeote KM3_115_A12 TaxID=1457854 RepID=A0A075GD52_9EURY|nr:Molybdopterin-guanine dinucleotide biosynthesis protein A (mobA) [uncultured marine group II/III euryarchaeote KM3_115_A12]